MYSNLIIVILLVVSLFGINVFFSLKKEQLRNESEKRIKGYEDSTQEVIDALNSRPLLVTRLEDFYEELEINDDEFLKLFKGVNWQEADFENIDEFLSLIRDNSNYNVTKKK